MDTEDYLGVYVRYRIAGGRMKLKEFHNGNELCYAQFPGIELSEVGVWTEDRNNIPPCEWTMISKENREWFTPSSQSQSTSAKQLDTGLIDVKCYGEGNIQPQDTMRNSYRYVVTSDPDSNMKMGTTTSLAQRIRGTKGRYIACT